MSEKTKQMVVVELTRNSAYLLPPVEGTGVPEEGAGKLLIPGENEITAVCWERAKKNPGVRISLKRDWLRKLDKQQADTSVRDWDSLTVGRAAEIISNIEDIDKLVTIKGKVTKKGIKDTCDKRIRELHTSNEKKNS